MGHLMIYFLDRLNHNNKIIIIKIGSIIIVSLCGRTQRGDRVSVHVSKISPGEF